jgi:Raf kinase inhibitor-like YbhB/YbcL family protein
MAVLLIALVGASCGNDTEVTPTAPEEQAVTTGATNFSVGSSAMVDGGELPIEFTCDGSSTSPPIEWTDPPAGATSLAVVMDHEAPGGDWHWYWTLWGIDPTTTGLPAGSTGDAIVGTNSVNGQLGYTPPCSQGPGEKAYTITVFALSEPLDLTDPGSVDRDVLLDAVDGITLATASITVSYTRS